MKKRPGLTKAITFIDQFIRSHDSDARFPTIRALASAADVSFVTMWKAVDHLRKAGVLIRSGKKGRFAGLKPALPPDTQKTAILPVECNEHLWEKVASHLRKDILTGRFPAGMPLPSLKDLRNSYNISHPTLKKALHKLWKEKILITYQRSYAVPSFSKSKSSTRIVAICCGWEDGTLWVDHQDKTYFRILEAECIKLKITLDIVVYYQKEGSLFFIDSISCRRYDFSNPNILSALFIVANLEIPPERVVRHLSAFKKPLAVLDVVGGWVLSPPTANGTSLQLFTATTSPLAQREVSRFLLSLGHTSIAYISPFQKACWSKRRYDDIRDIYSDAGFPDNVFPFVFSQYGYQWDYLQKGHENVNDIKALIAQYNIWQMQAEPEIFRKFGSIGYNISRYLTEWNCATGEIYHRMIPLFKQALENKTITAWVMANDYAALLALDYLKENKIRVPGDLSIISFDNTPDAVEYQLTSYDFNLNGIITMILNYAIRPSTIPRSQGKKTLASEGAIIMRRSTARNVRQKA